MKNIILFCINIRCLLRTLFIWAEPSATIFQNARFELLHGWELDKTLRWHRPPPWQERCQLRSGPTHWLLGETSITLYDLCITLPKPPFKAQNIWIPALNLANCALAQTELYCNMASLPSWHIQMGTFTLLSPSLALDKDDEIIILQGINIWIVYNQMSLSPFVVLSSFSPTSDWLKAVILDFLLGLGFASGSWGSYCPPSWLGCPLSATWGHHVSSSFIPAWFWNDTVLIPLLPRYGIYFFTLFCLCACPYHVLAKPSPLSCS